MFGTFVRHNSPGLFVGLGKFALGFQRIGSALQIIGVRRLASAHNVVEHDECSGRLMLPMLGTRQGKGRLFPVVFDPRVGGHDWPLATTYKSALDYQTLVKTLDNVGDEALARRKSRAPFNRRSLDRINLRLSLFCFAHIHQVHRLSAAPGRLHASLYSVVLLGARPPVDAP
ncbi:hypothetical protein [Cupriavidus sp. D39]|uniref:hypothetical protein n=1 Tax=Cupriavidus sp. D39 TaxID=2997877 RepID=UPI002270A9B7|nr:hypothetical protein [Cupriavidus sp. D39]MCY0852815.1 hypothetical protein [Cupriavidus sp. D39]